MEDLLSCSWCALFFYKARSEAAQLSCCSWRHAVYSVIDFGPCYIAGCGLHCCPCFRNPDDKGQAGDRSYNFVLLAGQGMAGICRPQVEYPAALWPVQDFVKP